MSTWYISTTGSDTTGDGSSGNPYLTIGKCITVGVNGDTVKVMTGTYTITSTTNITKEFTITSNSGVKTDVVFDSNTTIFNIQSSNVNITYVTMQTSSTNALLTIDRMSTGTVSPTFWTNININNCNIKYVTTALELNGNFMINTNTFTRQSGTNIASIIKLYSNRETSSISSNTFTDSGPVQYIIYSTSTGSGTYLDRCNSKGGTLTIASNNIAFTNNSQVTTFLYHDYFNLYNYGTIGVNTQYNPNTKLSVNVNSNIISYSINSKTIVINTKTSTDYNMFGICNINTNTVSYTDYGIVHLGKNIDNTSVTIDSNDLNRSVFKIYSNTLDSFIIDSPLYKWDASIESSILDASNNVVSIGGNVSKWVDTINNTFIIPISTNYPKLESENRNNKTYRFIRHLKTTNAYMIQNTPSIRKGRTLFIVFKQHIGDHTFVELFLNDDTTQLRSYHNTNNEAAIHDEGTGDTSLINYNVRVWALKFESTKTRCIFPLNNDVTKPAFKNMNSIKLPDTLSRLIFGSLESSYNSSFCWYEINIYDNLLTDAAMLSYYNELMNKWGVTL